MRFSAERCAFAALAAVAVFGMASGTATAGPITFNSTTLVGIQQNDNRPCVINDESCKNKPSGWDNEAVSGTPGGGNGSTYDLFSPSYLVVAGTAVVVNVGGEDRIPQTFDMLIDMNIAAGFPLEVLQFFKTYDCGLSTTVSPGGNIGAGDSIPAGCTLDVANSFIPAVGQAIPNNNNGNGFSDAGLEGFSLLLNHHYLFEARVSGDTDGMEEFFILPTVPDCPDCTPTPHGTVPEPASMLLLGTGLAGLASRLRKRA